MALLKCVDCGNMVSDRAGACPKCGCPIKVIIAEYSDGRAQNDIASSNGESGQGTASINVDGILNGLKEKYVNELMDLVLDDDLVNLSYNEFSRDIKDTLRNYADKAKDTVKDVIGDSNPDAKKALFSYDCGRHARKALVYCKEVKDNYELIGWVYDEKKWKSMCNDKQIKIIRPAEMAISESLLPGGEYVNKSAQVLLNDIKKEATTIERELIVSANLFVSAKMAEEVIKILSEIQQIITEERANDRVEERTNKRIEERTEEKPEKKPEKKSEDATSIKSSNDLVCTILNRNFKIQSGRREYIAIRRAYEVIAAECHTRISEIYQKNLGDVITYSIDFMNQVMPNLVHISVQTLYKVGIIISEENFLAKNCDLVFNYEDMVSEVVAKYAEITDEQQQLEQYRAMQKASRSRFVGGGFGVKGAIKGAATAGVLNAGLNFARSFGDSKRENQDRAYINKKLSDLKNSSFCKTRVIDGAYSCVLSVFDAMLRECMQKCEYIVPYTENDRLDAKNLYDATKAYEEDEARKLDNYIQVLNNYPYIRDPYKDLIRAAKDKSDFDSLDIIYMLLYNLGIMRINYGAPAFDNVEENYLVADYVEKSDVLRNINYDELSFEQYEKVSKEISKMKKIITEKLGEFPLANYRYHQLDLYIQKCQKEFGKEKLADVINNDDALKNLPMEEFVLRLVKDQLLEFLLGPFPVDSFFVPGTALYNRDLGPRQSDIDTFYNPKLKKGERFLLVFDSSFTHLAKAGFGISQNYIYAFKDKMSLKLLDVSDIILREVDHTLIIASNDMIKNLHIKLKYQFADETEKNEYSKTILKLVKRIVDHYKTINWSEKEANSKKSVSTDAKEQDEIIRSKPRSEYIEEEFETVIEYPDELQLIVQNVYFELEKELKETIFKINNVYEEMKDEYGDVQTLTFPKVSVKTYRSIYSPLNEKAITSECEDDEYVFAEVVEYGKYTETITGYIITDKRLVFRKAYGTQNGNEIRYQTYMLSNIVDYKKESCKKGMFSKGVSTKFFVKDEEGSVIEDKNIFSFSTKTTSGVCDLFTVLVRIIDARKVKQENQEVEQNINNLEITEDKSETNVDEKRFCVYCGNKISRKAKFCNYCGKENKY